MADNVNGPEITGRLVIEYSRALGVRHELQGEFPPADLAMALDVIKAALIAKHVNALIMRERAEAAKKVQVAGGSPFAK